ncbi:hypothetical protein LSAT2_006382, partial [Lamellibrachia satsuma]
VVTNHLCRATSKCSALASSPTSHNFHYLLCRQLRPSTLVTCIYLFPE